MIKQCRFSKSIRFFERGFCDKWGVVPYKKINRSCFFAGVYKQEDVDAINNHKGFKIVWPTGNIRDVFWNINPENVIVRLSSLEPSIYHEIEKKYKCRYVNFPIKDFSMFQPNIFGDSVYVYLGNQKRKDVYGYNIMKEIERKIPYRVLYGIHPKPLADNIKYIKREFYDKCFVNIKIHILGGFTTATELAYMGRYSISNGHAPFCIGYRDNDYIVKLIEKEAVKIGTVQNPVIGNWFDTGEEWKNENFWEDCSYV